MNLLIILGAVFVNILHYSNAVTIGFTESDYPAFEETGLAKIILTVADYPSNLTIPLVIMSFEQFNNSNLKLPDDVPVVSDDPAEYSIDPRGRRDFVNNGVIEVTFPPSRERISQEIIIPIVDDEYNEAPESFLVLIDPSFRIPEEVPDILRNGIALITITDNDPIQLQFDRTTYTVHETDGYLEELIKVTKGGVISEQVLEGNVNIVDISPNTAEMDVDYTTNRTHVLTFYPENDSLPIPVTIFDDQMVENTEQFRLVMSTANSLATNGKNRSATVFIIDSSDLVIGFENTSYTILEGDTSELCITIKEPRDATLDFLVPTLIASQDGSAIATRDYVAVRNIISPSGKTCFEVVTIDNDDTGPNRNFTITLTFMPFGISRTLNTDTPSITIEIVDDDRNPCEENDCHANADCVASQSSSSYQCICRPGFTGDGRSCVDYCEGNLHNCAATADCIPNAEGFSCRCKRGYVGDGQNCVGLCSPGTHDCHPRGFCVPLFDRSTYSCHCGIGTVGDGRTCEDYCTAGVHNCHRLADCSLTFGGYRCTCRPGYVGNGVICADVNECLSENKCDVNANCINTDGGYACSCKEGFLGDGLNCIRIILREEPTTQTTEEPTTLLPTTTEPPPTTTEPPPTTTEPPPTTTEPPPTTTEPDVPSTTEPPRPPVACDPEGSSRSTRSRTSGRSRSTRKTKTTRRRDTGTGTGRDNIALDDNGTNTGTRSRTGTSGTTRTSRTGTGTRTGRGNIALDDNGTNTGTRSRTGTSGTTRTSRTGTGTRTGRGNIALDDNGTNTGTRSRTGTSGTTRTSRTGTETRTGTRTGTDNDDIALDFNGCGQQRDSETSKNDSTKSRSTRSHRTKSRSHSRSKKYSSRSHR